MLKKTVKINQEVLFFLEMTVMTLHWAKISDKLNRRSHIICKNFPKISMKSFFLSAGSRLSVAAARSTNLQKLDEYFSNTFNNI